MATLYIVATPIGNLKDVSLRAIEILNSVSFILSEDTRITDRLLQAHGVSGKSLIVYHQHSGEDVIAKVANILKEGHDVALVTDAGTPGIQDPGNYLISRLLEINPDLNVAPIPGPNAAIAALSVSGFVTDHFVFMGFAPHKKGRKTFFERISQTPEVVVMYESKFRILKALEELKNVAQIGERKVMVARELTKQFETIYRGTVDQILEKLNNDKVLGEFVIVIDRK